jgi:N-acetylglucosaminyldiphosphoundecaprenol N-acetyl-beta-D-mannosaminyltransferase
MIPDPPSLTTADPPRRRILGVRVDDVTLPEALERLGRYAASGTPHQVVTPNPEIVMLARRNGAYRAVIEAADLAVPDGIGLVWAGRLLGQPLRGLAPGSELVEPLAARCAPRGGRWFLLGAAPGVAEAVGRRLAADHPGLCIAGTFAGAPDPASDVAICRRIEAAGPVDVLLVAYGAPAQDLWIARNQPRLRVPLALGVGGTFNFNAGVSRRPPATVKRLHLIWLYRLVSEPWRWRRQTALARFAAAVVHAALTPGAGRTTTRT